MIGFKLFSDWRFFTKGMLIATQSSQTVLCKVLVVARCGRTAAKYLLQIFPVCVDNVILNTLWKESLDGANSNVSDYSSAPLQLTLMINIHKNLGSSEKRNHQQSPFLCLLVCLIGCQCIPVHQKTKRKKTMKHEFKVKIIFFKDINYKKKNVMQFFFLSP